MNIKDVKRFAKEKNVNIYYSMSKKDMIRLVQWAENTFCCFGTKRVAHCNEYACLWRNDCISEDKKGQSL